MLSNEIILDRAKLTSYVQVRLQQGEFNTRSVPVTITENNEVIDLLDTTSVTFTMLKQDGIPIVNDCSIEENKAIIEITPEISDTEGIHSAQLIISDNTIGLSKSVLFKIMVDKAVIQDQIIASVSQFTALDNALLSINEFYNSGNNLLNSYDNLFSNKLVDVDNQFDSKLTEINNQFDTKYTDIGTQFDGLYTSKEDSLNGLYTAKETSLNELYNTKAGELDDLEADYSDRAETLETTYAPRLTSAESQLAAKANQVDLDSMAADVLLKASQSSLDTTNAAVALKADKSEVTNIMTPKGNIAYASLPMSGNTVGWYYYCSDGDGTHGAGNYVWNGTAWYFGGTGNEGYNIVKNDLEIRSGVAEITFIDGYNITLAFALGTVVNLTPSVVPSYRYAVVNCQYGDVFTIAGVGGNNPRLYGFLDADNKLLQVATASISWTYGNIVAPYGAVKLIINDAKSGRRCYKGNFSSYELSGVIPIEGKGTQSGGTSGITGVGQYYFNESLGTIDKCSSYTSSTQFSHYSIPTVDGRIVHLNQSLYEVIGGNLKPLRSGSVINIVGKGSLSLNTAGVTKAGQYYVGNDNNLRLCTYYSSSSLFTDMVVDFSTDVIYLYNGDLYRYTGSNNFLGLVKISGGKTSISWNGTDKNITLGSYNIGDVVSVVPGTVTGWTYAIVECSEGDPFTLNLIGGNNPRAWGFLDSSYKLLSRAGAYAVAIDEVIYAPYGAKYLVLNTNLSDTRIISSAYYGVTQFNNTKNTVFKSTNGNHNLIPLSEDSICSFVKGIKFTDELTAPIIDFKKAGDLMVHVSTFAIINGIVYCTYYANTRSSQELASQQTARFAYCPLNNPSNITYIDLQDVGQTFDSKTVNEVYDTILLRKDDDVLYLMWTASLNGVYYRLYRTFTISTGVLSDIAINNFYVNSTGGQWNATNMISALNTENIRHRDVTGDIGIMQKLTSRVEGGTTYYYTGAYVGGFNCIIKSSDLISWYFVASPDFKNDAQWENAVYVLNDKVYYFVRQYSKYNTGFLTYYDLINKLWSDPVFIDDCQSRSDFFVYGGNLYLVHAPKDRNHISIMYINQGSLNKSYEVQTAKVPDYFYPFVQIYNGELYMSFTQTRQHIWLSKFTIGTVSTDTIISKFKTLFLT